MQEWMFHFWLPMAITGFAPVGIATRTFRLPVALWVFGLSERTLIAILRPCPLLFSSSRSYSAQPRRPKYSVGFWRVQARGICTASCATRPAMAECQRVPSMLLTPFTTVFRCFHLPVSFSEPLERMSAAQKLTSALSLPPVRAVPQGLRLAN